MPSDYSPLQVNGNGTGVNILPRISAFQPHTYPLGNMLRFARVLPYAWPIFTCAEGELGLEPTLRQFGSITRLHSFTLLGAATCPIFLESPIRYAPRDGSEVVVYPWSGKKTQMVDFQVSVIRQGTRGARPSFLELSGYGRPAGL